MGPLSPANKNHGAPGPPPSSGRPRPLMAPSSPPSCRHFHPAPKGARWVPLPAPPATRPGSPPGGGLPFGCFAPPFGDDHGAAPGVGGQFFPLRPPGWGPVRHVHGRGGNLWRGAPGASPEVVSQEFWGQKRRNRQPGSRHYSSPRPPPGRARFPLSPSLPWKRVKKKKKKREEEEERLRGRIYLTIYFFE